MIIKTTISLFLMLQFRILMLIKIIKIILLLSCCSGIVLTIARFVLVVLIIKTTYGFLETFPFSKYRNYLAGDEPIEREFINNDFMVNSLL